MAIVLLAGATTLVVAAYVAASRREVEGTTEVANLEPYLLAIPRA